MISEKLELRFEGKVTFNKYDAYNKLIKRITLKNAIQPQAKEIAAKRLIENSTSKIDIIEVYNGVTLLSAKPITATNIISPTEVEFDAVFDGPSFNSIFTEVRLKASGIINGYFSKLTGLVDAKDNTQSIMVSWNIKIV